MLPRLAGQVIGTRDQQLESEEKECSGHLHVLLASLRLDNHSPPSKIAFLCIRAVAHSDQVFTRLQHNLLNVLAVVAQNAEIVAHFFPSLRLALLSPLR